MSHAVEQFLLDTFQYRPDILTGDTFLRGPEIFDTWDTDDYDPDGEWTEEVDEYYHEEDFYDEFDEIDEDWL